MSEFEEPMLSKKEDDLIFSKEQVTYLRDEFERQRRWVNLLSTREKVALEELEQTHSSVSYRFGRFVTWLPRKIIKLLSSNSKSKIVYFVNEEDEQKERDLFPSSLLITPELLPTSNSKRKVEHLVEEVLIAIKRGNLSVNGSRDMFSEGSFTMNDEQQLESAQIILNHILNVKEYSPSVKNVYVGVLRALSQRNSHSSIIFGDQFQNIIQDKRALRTLVQSHGKCGNFSLTLDYLSRMPRSAWRSEQENRFRAANRILKNNLRIKTPKIDKISPKKDSILYHASQSMPHTSSGYAIRTHGLVSALKSKGMNIETLLRYGYPLDRHDFEETQINPFEIIENVRYNFSHTNKSDTSLINYQEIYSFNKLEKYLRRAISSVYTNAKRTRPMIIHSASNFVVGLAGAKAAKELGIPSIYEIRGFWHLTQSTKKQGYEGSDHYNLTEQLEFETAKISDYVFTITQALKDILVENGISEDKISVLPNAVDPEKFKIHAKDKSLEKELQFEKKVVIGYIGSFVNYEGLDLLLEACSILYKKLGDCFRLMLVGDGEMIHSLRKSVRFLQLEDIVKFTGRVKHDQVNRYYSLIDIAPLPRKGLRVCELVTPLKPFEAMASGKVLITSNVEALAEIVDDGVTGFVFEKDNAEDLAEKLELVITNESLRREIGQKAHDWVKETHSWEVVSQHVVEVYQKLMEGK